MYINAEYLIDRNKIKQVGDFINKDTKITLPKLMIEDTTEINPLLEWKNMDHGFYPCGACSVFSCKKANKYILDEVSPLNYR